MPINPIQIIQMIKNGENPQQLMLQMLEENASSNPILSNVLSLAKEHREEDIEQVARNLMAEKGLDFDKEFNNFKHYLGIFK